MDDQEYRYELADVIDQFTRNQRYTAVAWIHGRMDAETASTAQKADFLYLREQVAEIRRRHGVEDQT